MKRYIATDLLVAKQNQLNLYEWAMLEQIHFLSNNSQGSCYASKETFADILQISRRTVFNLLSKLEQKEFISKTENGSLKVTNKWIYIANGNSAKFALSVQNLHNDSAKNALEIVQNLHTKEDNKGSNKGEARAIDFLKENYNADYEIFLMQNKKQIKNFEKFEADFNDKVDIEQLNFNNKVLFGRLQIFARNYIVNDHKFNKPAETNVIPIYRRKISV